ncbi:hypothetical protein QQP08_016882, partial [Theobroma cacao]
MHCNIAKPLETGQEATARIWFIFTKKMVDSYKEVMIGFTFQVEHIIREENMLATQEIFELFCELSYKIFLLIFEFAVLV